MTIIITIITIRAETNLRSMEHRVSLLQPSASRIREINTFNKQTNKQTGIDSMLIKSRNKNENFFTATH